MRKCRKSLSHRCKPCSHRCEPLSHQCKRLFLHFRTGAPNHLSHSPLTTLGQFVDTEYDRANVPPYNGNDPPPAPGCLKRSLFSNPIKRSTKQGNARGTSEVRRGTSSNHFHCPVPPVVQSYRSPNLGDFRVSETSPCSTAARSSAHCLGGTSPERNWNE